MGAIKLDVLCCDGEKNRRTLRMSPEQQKIVIFSGNRHISDGSAAGSDVRSREGCGMLETVRLIEPVRYQDTHRIMDGRGMMAY